MIRTSHLTGLLLFLTSIAATAAAADDRKTTHRPVDEHTLRGTYVFSGRVLLNPILGAPNQAAPTRALVDCFSIGEVRFDGRGTIRRRVEIRCPTTPTMVSAGLGVPVPPGEPGAVQLQVIGTTLTSEGSYELGADGWGTYTDAGAFRLGPIPGNPASGAGRIAVTQIRGGVAQEVVLLIDHQSMQPPGAPGLVNSDIGASFTARRR